MNWWKRLAVLLSSALLCAILIPRASADEWNKKTIVTFGEAVEVPGGLVLQPGTYVFKLMDSPSNRNIVQIFDKDETHLYATILAIPDYRLQPTDKTVLTFEERPLGSAEAIKAWFYPGETYGQAFVYPKSRAVELAKASNEQVPAMPSELSSNVTQPAQSPSEPQVAAMENAPVRGVGPNGEEQEMSQAGTTQQPAGSQTSQEASTTSELPKTASPLPLVGLVGAFLLAAGLTLRVLSKRVA